MRQRHEIPDLVRLPDEPANHLARFGMVLLSLLVVLLLLSIAYLVGEKLHNFSWTTLRNGLLAFATILLAVVFAVVVLTLTVRFVLLLLPRQTKHMLERRQLEKAKKDALKTISEKERLGEERVRITARLQATFLYEKESTRAANQRAAREFREALQAGVVRSCGVAFDHIAMVVDEYERLVAEITECELPPQEKTALLQKLTRQLDVAAQQRQDRGARELMTAEIWKVRLRKARLLARENSAAAVRYLESLIPSARGAEMQKRIRSMIEELTTAVPVEGQPAAAE